MMSIVGLSLLARDDPTIADGEQLHHFLFTRPQDHAHGLTIHEVDIVTTREFDVELLRRLQIGVGEGGRDTTCVTCG